MKRLVLLLVLLVATSSPTTAARWPLSAAQQADGDKAQQQRQQQQQQQQDRIVHAQQGMVMMPPAQPSAFQQLQQQLQKDLSPNSNSNSGSGTNNGQQGTSNSAQPAPLLPPAQPSTFQQLQQQLQKDLFPNSNSSSSGQQRSNDTSFSTPLMPSMQFVTISKQERPVELTQAQQQQQKQQKQQQQDPKANPSDKFECGKSLMPCGCAIPEGKNCENGPGWCEAGHFCGYESTTTEPSRCLPLPKDCGKAGQPCCPSNADRPHSNLQDKLDRRPFCRDGSVCFYYAPVPGLNNGDMFAGNKGAYACTAVAADCGTGPGKPCCPFAYKISTNPQLNRTGCADPLFCNYDSSAAAAAAETRLEYSPASVAGTCEANAADCGQFGKPCCIATAASATSTSCGARWNETGQRGYCADPFDSNNSAGPQAALGGGSAGAGRASLLTSSGSSSGSGSSGGSSGGGGGGGKRKASYKELVCTQCPPRSDDVANNPSRYWPC